MLAYYNKTIIHETIIISDSDEEKSDDKPDDETMIISDSDEEKSEDKPDEESDE